MTKSLVQPYLFFAGRSDEAIEFYRTALGAEVEMRMAFKENPEPGQGMPIPPGWESKVMHASIKVGGGTIMLSDGCGPDSKGFHGFSLSFSAPDEAEAKRAFAALSEGGEVSMPLTKTFYSPCFGMVTDRFGICWMVIVPGSQSQS
jgi:PhnB protein